MPSYMIDVGHMCFWCCSDWSINQHNLKSSQWLQLIDHGFFLSSMSIIQGSMISYVSQICPCPCPKRSVLCCSFPDAFIRLKCVVCRGFVSWGIGGLLRYRDFIRRLLPCLAMIISWMISANCWWSFYLTCHEWFEFECSWRMSEADGVRSRI